MPFLLCLIAAGLLPGVELAIRQFQTDYPDVTVCESKMTDKYSYDMPHSYMYLKGHFGGLSNCTHIEGNLVLRNIWPDPEEPDLSFLQSIVEVSGMLVMKNNSLSSVILPRLRVIRGDQSVPVKWRNRVTHPASLAVELVAGADAGHVVLPSLRAIMKHSVHFRTFSPHPLLPGSILWQELFENPAQQQLLTIDPLTGPAPYHSACSTDSTMTLPGRCWSTSEQHCQKRAKCVERRKDGCNWCYFKRLGNATLEDCCHEECSGGCHGKSNSDCLLCRNYMENATCLISCPQALVFADGRWRQNPNFKLRVGMMCASACPANLLQQEDSCIYKCNSSRFFRQGDKCLPCSSSSNCDIAECRTDAFHKSETDSFFMTMEVLANFTDCEHVTGEVVFNANSFDKSKGNISVEMLYRHLRKLKYITGHLMIADSGPDLRNLMFLEQLVEIQYQPMGSNTAALNLASTQLQFLGLRRLRRVSGEVHSHNNSALCFLATLPWDSHILVNSQFGASVAPCAKEVCHSQCGRLGCWGPSSSMCFACAGVRAGPNCVTACEQEPGFYTAERLANRGPSDYDDGTCRQCHPLCLRNCTGPGPDNCVGGCRHLQELNRCVDKCSDNHFQRGLTCERCDPLCRRGRWDRPVCTGNGTFVGSGGCEFCAQFVQSGAGALQCHGDAKCPRGSYTGVLSSAKAFGGQQDYFDQFITVCVTCTRPCAECSGPSISVASCLACDGYWSRDDCVETCDKDRLRAAGANLTGGGECPYCHEQCQIGCRQPYNQSQCTSCRNRRLYHADQPSNQFSCLASCQPPHNYSYKDELSGDFLCVLQSQWESHELLPRRQIIHKKVLWVLGPALLLVLLLATLLLYRAYQNKLSRSRQLLRELYSNIQEPDSRSLITSRGIVPNMNRLLLIPKTSLRFSVNDKPLGTGAFGAVYKGQWVFSRDSKGRAMTNSMDVAIKVVRASRDIDIGDILEEMKVMASVCHKHCLRLIGVCLNHEVPCLVTTFVELGSLDKYLRKHRDRLSSYNLLSWAEQIANGMVYLEMRNIIHRDLATRNVLLSNLNLVQITDFGLSQMLLGTESTDEIVITRGQVPIRWLALETLISGVYSHKTDVWAYGVTLWEIFSYGQRPYDELDARDITPFLLQNNRLCQPEICSMDLYGLMLRCWLEVPQFRPGFDELMSTLADYTRHPTFYLHISNDPCLTFQAMRKRRLQSQCSYELHQFPPRQHKGIYQQHSLDGTVSTFIGDYSDDLVDRCVSRQYSNLSWDFKKYHCTDDIHDPRRNLLHCPSTLSEDVEYLDPITTRSGGHLDCALEQNSHWNERLEIIG